MVAKIFSFASPYINTLFPNGLSQFSAFENNPRVNFNRSDIPMNKSNYLYFTLFYATRHPEENINFSHCEIPWDRTNDNLSRLKGDILILDPTVAVPMHEEKNLSPSVYLTKRENESSISEKRQYPIESWCQDNEKNQR